MYSQSLAVTADHIIEMHRNSRRAIPLYFKWAVVSFLWLWHTHIYVILMADEPWGCTHLSRHLCSEFHNTLSPQTLYKSKQFITTKLTLAFLTGYPKEKLKIMSNTDGTLVKVEKEQPKNSSAVVSSENVEQNSLTSQNSKDVEKAAGKTSF